MATFGKSDFIEKNSVRAQIARVGPFVDQKRIEIVDKKIKGQLPFTLGPKEGGQKVYGVGFLSKTGEKPTTKNWPWVLTYSKTQNWRPGDHSDTVNINKFYKDPDFGGGGKGLVAAHHKQI